MNEKYCQKCSVGPDKHLAGGACPKPVWYVCGCNGHGSIHLAAEGLSWSCDRCGESGTCPMVGTPEADAVDRLAAERWGK